MKSESFCIKKQTPSFFLSFFLSIPSFHSEFSFFNSESFLFLFQSIHFQFFFSPTSSQLSVQMCEACSCNTAFLLACAIWVNYFDFFSFFFSSFFIPADIFPPFLLLSNRLPNRTSTCHSHQQCFFNSLQVAQTWRYTSQ